MNESRKECELIRKIALENGFKLKKQPSGETDLNPYVFDFAEKLLAEKKAEINKLKRKLEKIESGEFVLVPRDKIEVFWQDDDEPENFCSLESDLECLGDGIDLNEIMTINAHHQVNLKTEKMYGTWFAEFGHPKEKANFHVGTHQECLDIVAKNKAMIEASQQPTNLIDSFIADGGFDRVMGCKNGE